MNDHPVEMCAFGTAAPPVETQKRREASCWRLLNILSSFLLPDWREETFASANDVEKLFGCVARRDSFDWFTIARQLGHPSARLAATIAAEIRALSAAIKDRDRDAFADARTVLLELPTRRCIYAFLKRKKIADEPKAGWIFMLANADLISAGITTHTVEHRLEEINRATDVENTFGIYRCWRVSDPVRAENIVIEALSKSGCFRAPTSVAGMKLDAAIDESGLEIRTLNAFGSLEERHLWAIFPRHFVGGYRKASSRH
ncbi:GIY-YIG nuclease family protein [Hyphomicrobium facile]|uniref:Uncharacterized protein n=1 Tax=Hyphomicrobium facile TaxID=51670 RepID=A0A1I7NFB5_9HYPH|nr:GIY-YIG nuclease family protein [Hyphomicrobium facile]SFV33367.1 hypothetical protein SAMN04488557_1949 [Hyphomicrobium facile]